MESTGGSSGSTITAAAAMPSPSVVADNSKGKFVCMFVIYLLLKSYVILFKARQIIN